MGNLLSVPWYIYFILYFVPTLVARFRGLETVRGIGVVNLFLGWTFIGWVVALAWALTGKRPAPATI